MQYLCFRVLRTRKKQTSSSSTSPQAVAAILEPAPGGHYKKTRFFAHPHVFSSSLFAFIFQFESDRMLHPFCATQWSILEKKVGREARSTEWSVHHRTCHVYFFKIWFYALFMVKTPNYDYWDYKRDFVDRYKCIWMIWLITS